MRNRGLVGRNPDRWARRYLGILFCSCDCLANDIAYLVANAGANAWMAGKKQRFRQVQRRAVVL